VTDTARWPALPLKEWQDTYATLHRWTQIVGKTRLGLTAVENHWWNATLYVSPRGLTTSLVHVGTRGFDVAFDFIDHQLVIRTSDGQQVKLPLVAQSVADFYAQYTNTMQELGIALKIYPVPVEIVDATPFAEDRAHASYDPEYANRLWRILFASDKVFKRFRARFLGKSSPVHFFWGGFDSAVTRFSGRPAPKHGGGIPNCPNWVMEEAYSHEVISAGFWPGSAGMLDEPAFYAYSYPEPSGFAEAHVEPAAAYYHPTLHEFILPYESVRQSRTPEKDLLEFLQSTYEAGAELAKWDRKLLERDLASPFFS
jgi:hypothetical protein